MDGILSRGQKFYQHTGFFFKQIRAVFLILIFPGLCFAEQGVDNSIYAALLKQHVVRNRVNYDGFKKDEQIFDQYLDLLGRTNAQTLSAKARFAFYINAYNAFTIKLILTKYPKINSIKEIGSFFSNPWSKKFILLNGKTLSLDNIEHDILRPQFKDPRVHFAINCAAKSCPPLMNAPYEGDILDIQLDDRAKRFINDPHQTFVRDNTLFISKIFKWFDQDFSDNPFLFIRQYASGQLITQLNALGPKPKLKFLDYDWTLNRY